MTPRAGCSRITHLQPTVIGTFTVSNGHGTPAVMRPSKKFYPQEQSPIAGVDYRKVDWIELQFPTMPDGLKAGLADAVSVVDPFLHRILGTKTGYVIGAEKVRP